MALLITLFPVVGNELIEITRVGVVFYQIMTVMAANSDHCATLYHIDIKTTLYLYVLQDSFHSNLD